MNDIAVAVRGLSKLYVIAHNATKHTTLTEAITHRFKNPLLRPEKQTFWDLKDIEFDIKKGDVVGITCRNGSGKSTLLKVLSQIMEPTTGEVRLYDRLANLREVGTMTEFIKVDVKSLMVFKHAQLHPDCCCGHSISGSFVLGRGCNKFHCRASERKAAIFLSAGLV